jgi:hypothetical protein
MLSPAARNAVAQRCRRLLVLATALSLSLAMAVPLAARPQPKPQRMDLAVRPADVRLKPPVVVLEPLSALEEPEVPGVALADPVAEIDQVERTEIPDRRRAKSGLQLGDNGLLQELLEDKTIPIFRVTVEPPF